MRFRDYLQHKIQSWLYPELFSGAPQPHEDKTLADGPAIQEARKKALLKVGPMAMGVAVDGDRVMVFFGEHQIWITVEGADGMAHALVEATNFIRQTHGEQLQTHQGRRQENALDISGYSFLIRTSKGLVRFDKKLTGAFINPGEDVAYAAVQFVLGPDGDIACGEGWERAL